mmetsp:Transcript_12856/g.32432  ORF Transcript_12856/g.32432 Transcript_12856/m.32432 type:complete len:408 (-) Transcript_12856:415-1638(-)
MIANPIGVTGHLCPNLTFLASLWLREWSIFPLDGLASRIIQASLLAPLNTGDTWNGCTSSTPVGRVVIEIAQPTSMRGVVAEVREALQIRMVSAKSHANMFAHGFHPLWLCNPDLALHASLCRLAAISQGCGAVLELDGTTGWVADACLLAALKREDTDRFDALPVAVSRGVGGIQAASISTARSLLPEASCVESRLAVRHADVIWSRLRPLRHASPNLTLLSSSSTTSSVLPFDRSACRVGRTHVLALLQRCHIDRVVAVANAIEGPVFGGVLEVHAASVPTRGLINKVGPSMHVCEHSVEGEAFVVRRWLRKQGAHVPELAFAIGVLILNALAIQKPLAGRLTLFQRHRLKNGPILVEGVVGIDGLIVNVQAASRFPTVCSQVGKATSISAVVVDAPYATHVRRA